MLSLGMCVLIADSLLVFTGVAAIAAATKGAKVWDGLKVTTGVVQGRSRVAPLTKLPSALLGAVPCPSMLW